MATSTLSPLPPPKPPQLRSFVFVNDSNPKEAKSKAKRKLVRAQAARGPHSNTLTGSVKPEKSAPPTVSKHQKLKRSKRTNGTTTIPLDVAGLEDILAPAPAEKIPAKPHKNSPITVSVENKGDESDEEQTSSATATSAPSVIIYATQAPEPLSVVGYATTTTSQTLVTCATEVDAPQPFYTDAFQPSLAQPLNAYTNPSQPNRRFDGQRTQVETPLPLTVPSTQAHTRQLLNRPKANRKVSALVDSYNARSQAAPITARNTSPTSSIPPSSVRNAQPQAPPPPYKLLTFPKFAQPLNIYAAQSKPAQEVTKHTPSPASSRTREKSGSPQARVSQDGTSPSNTSSTEHIPQAPQTLCGWVAPFFAYPDPKRPYIPMLIDHYLRNMAVALPELDADTPFVLRRKFFPLVITHPSTFYVIMLTAGSHYAASRKMLHRPDVRAALLDLKGITLASINQLMRETPLDKPPSDVIISAVCKMASYEAMFGTPTLFHTHMRGLQSMINKRGGLLGLGLEGFIMRMVMWIDINSAFILGNMTYFETCTPLAGNTAHYAPESVPLAPENFTQRFGPNGSQVAGNIVPPTENLISDINERRADAWVA